MVLTLLPGADDRSADARFCKRWLSAADELRTQMDHGGEGLDPFLYNETATVGLLVAAAGRARFMALPEFVENNRALPEGRVRAGRCDLWLASADWSIDWLVEFKQCWYGPRPRTTLIDRLNAAIKAVFERDRQESRDRWGCAVYVPGPSSFEKGCRRDAWTAGANLERLARHVELGFKLEGADAPVYLLLRKIPLMARSIDRYLLDPELLASGGT